MTPVEWKFFETMLELSAQRAYVVGYEDGLKKDKPKPDHFKLTKSNKLVLRTELQKFVEKR